MKGKIALITGASRGIGRAIAIRLAGEGCDVALVARDESRLQAVAQEVTNLGVRASVVIADLSDGAQVDGVVARTQESLGSPSFIVANAGITADQLAMRLRPEDWDRVIAVNLTGAFRLVRAALPAMVRAREGRIVFISSVAGLMGNPGQAAYAASKAGMIGLAKSLAKEVGSRGITVNVVAPGLIDTDMASALPEARRLEMVSHVPLGRLGKADEVAGAVAFLLGKDAGYVTGDVLNMSGGLYM